MNWYENLHAQVKVGNFLSDHLPIRRGIRQGSVMSPSLFNLVMDPLLAGLKSEDLGLSIQGLFLGAFAHANDIRTATTNQDDTAEQVKNVASFVDRNGLKLSTEKCGIVITGRDGMDPPPSVAGLPVEDYVSALVYVGALTPPAESQLKNVSVNNAEPSSLTVTWVPSTAY